MSISRIAQALIIGTLAEMEGTLEAQEKARRMLESHRRMMPFPEIPVPDAHHHTVEAIRAERLARKRANFEKRQPSNTTPTKGTP